MARSPGRGAQRVATEQLERRQPGQPLDHSLRQREAEQTRRVLHREVEAHAPAEVVGHHVDPVDPQAIEQQLDIGGDGRLVVAAVGAVGPAEAPQIGDDQAMSRRSRGITRWNASPVCGKPCSSTIDVGPEYQGTWTVRGPSDSLARP